MTPEQREEIARNVLSHPTQNVLDILAAALELYAFAQRQSGDLLMEAGYGNQARALHNRARRSEQIATEVNLITPMRSLTDERAD